jgi:hypothetical protein
MSLNVGDQECNSGKKYGQKGTLCGPNIQKYGFDDSLWHFALLQRTL